MRTQENNTTEGMEMAQDALTNLIAAPEQLANINESILTVLLKLSGSFLAPVQVHSLHEALHFFSQVQLAQAQMRKEVPNAIS